MVPSTPSRSGQLPLNCLLLAAVIRGSYLLPCQVVMAEDAAGNALPMCMFALDPQAVPDACCPRDHQPLGMSFS